MTPSSLWFPLVWRGVGALMSRIPNKRPGLRPWSFSAWSAPLSLHADLPGRREGASPTWYRRLPGNDALLDDQVRSQKSRSTCRAADDQDRHTALMSCRAEDPLRLGSEPTRPIERQKNRSGNSPLSIRRRERRMQGFRWGHPCSSVSIRRQASTTRSTDSGVHRDVVNRARCERARILSGAQRSPNCREVQKLT